VTAARRWGRALAGLAVALLFVALLVRRIDWAEVRQVLGGAAWLPLVLALVALSADMAARITRWWWMLRPVQPDLPWSSCARPFLASLAINNTVPLRAGDVVRVVGFQRTLRVPTAHVAGTLVLERMLDLLVLLLILFLSLSGIQGVFPKTFLVLAQLAGVLCVLALVALTFTPGAISRFIQGAIGRLAGGHSWADSANRLVDQLTASLALLRSPGRALKLLGFSVLAWLLEGIVFACVLESLQVAVPRTAAWLSLSAATLATLLPSSPGYIGTFDYFASLGLTAHGVSYSVAAAYALLAHLLLWLPVTLAGLCALFWGRKPRLSSRVGSPAPAQRSGVVR
jgi:glycosyltransferase 2 family protein